ncbi:MAG: TfoX/Sxy family protein [Eubacterium sp.]|nr:TfoX/Sxy family protein [Eubacterium sp.]
MTDLTSMRNIGKELERKLKLTGIDSAEALIALGSKEAYFKLKLRFPEVCSVHLYALQGAIDNIDFNMLPEEIKRDLKNFADALK